MLDQHPALAFCLSMILSENRFPLFRIMLYDQAADRAALTLTIMGIS